MKSGDPLKHASPGDPLSILNATAYNAFIDAALAHRAGRYFGAGSLSIGAVSKAYNGQGSNASKGSVVELRSRASTTAQIEFVQPGGAGGQGVYGILTEPIKDGGIGNVALGGGPLEALVSGSPDVGDRLGAQDGAWTLAADSGGDFVLVSDVSDGSAYVMFAAGGGSVIFPVRTDDPSDPEEGEAWIRSDLF